MLRRIQRPRIFWFVTVLVARSHGRLHSHELRLNLYSLSVKCIDMWVIKGRASGLAVSINYHYNVCANCPCLLHLTTFNLPVNQMNCAGLVTIVFKIYFGSKDEFVHVFPVGWCDFYGTMAAVGGLSILSNNKL